MPDNSSTSDVSVYKPPASTSLNSVRHGLRTVALVIPGESIGEWEDFSADALSALAPEGAIESALVERIVELLWRGRRVARAEQRAIVDEHECDRVAERRRVESAHEGREALGENSFYASAFNTEPRVVVRPLLPAEATLNPIMRYEAHLSRQLYRAMHELEALQAARNGRAVPLIRLGIHGLRGE